MNDFLWNALNGFVILFHKIYLSLSHCNFWNISVHIHCLNLEKLISLWRHEHKTTAALYNRILYETSWHKFVKNVHKCIFSHQKLWSIIMVMLSWPDIHLFWSNNSILFKLPTFFQFPYERRDFFLASACMTTLYTAIIVVIIGVESRAQYSTVVLRANFERHMNGGLKIRDRLLNLTTVKETCSRPTALNFLVLNISSCWCDYHSSSH